MVSVLALALVSTVAGMEIASAGFLITVGFVVLILVVFIWSMLLLWRVNRLQTRFKNARLTVVRQREEAATLTEARSGLISDLFESEVLQISWTQFCEEWKASHLPEVTHAGLVDVTDAFDLRELTARIAPMRTLHSIPGILLSLGILGTFLGLVVGLLGIEGLEGTGNLNGEQSAKLLSSVANLIGGLSIAFATSVVGILGSVTFLFCLKRRYAHAERAMAAFCTEVQTVFPKLSFEEWATRQVGYQYDQLQATKTLAADIATSVSESFGGTIQEHLTPMINDLREVIQSMAQKNSEAQIEVMQKLVTEFTEKLTESVGNQFTELGRNVGSVTESLSRVLTRLEDWSALQETLVEQTSSAAEVIGVQLPQLTSFGDRLKDVVQTLSLTVGEIDQLKSTLRDQIETAANAQVEASSAMASASSDLAVSAITLEKSSEALSASSTEIGGALERGLAEFESNIKQGVVDLLETFDSKLADILGRFSGALSDAHENVAQLREHSETVATVIGPAAQKLGEDVISLAEYTGTYTSNWAEIAKSIEEFRSSANELATGLAETVAKEGESLSAAAAIVQDGMSVSNSLISGFQEERQKFGDQLSQVRVNVGEALEKVEGSLTSSMSSIDKLTKALEGASQALPVAAAKPASVPQKPGARETMRSSQAVSDRVQAKPRDDKEAPSEPSPQPNKRESVRPAAARPRTAKEQSVSKPDAVKSDDAEAPDKRRGFFGKFFRR